MKPIFIDLTNIQNKDVTVNANTIKYLTENSDSTTLIVFTAGEPLDVKEPVYQIKQLIKVASL